MREVIAIGIMFLLLSQSTLAADLTEAQIASIPAEIKIEVSLKSGRKVKGTGGEVTPTDFTLLDQKASTIKSPLRIRQPHLRQPHQG